MTLSAGPSVLRPPDRRHRYRRVVPTPVLVALCVACAGLLVTAAVSLYRESPPAFLDLDVYRLGVRAWWHGGDMYGPLPRTIAVIRLPFIYPPFAALFLGPLVALPWPVAAVAMLVISLAGLITVVHLAVRRVWPAGGPRGALLATAVLTPLATQLQPVWDTLWFGQVNLLLMAMVALDCLVERPVWPRGLLIGGAVAVKLTPAVFVLYFLLRKDYRAAATALASGLAATAIGFVVNWSGSVRFWFGATGGARAVSGSTFATNQTIDAFFARLRLPHGEQTVLCLAVTAVVLVFAVAAIRRAFALGNDVLALSATGCLGLLVSPTSWGHHWVYAVPGLIAIGGYALRGRDIRWAGTFVVTAWVFRAAPFQGAAHAWAWLRQLPANSYTILGIALLVVFGAPRPGHRDSDPAASRRPAAALSSHRD
jgi:alpha-1,2-mannosyltransferase